MTMLRNAVKWLDEQRQLHLTEPIIYNCKNGDILEVNATLGKTIFRAENEYGEVIRVTSVDFLISETELDITPQKGDTIIYNSYKYEVLAPNGESHWRWCSSAHLTRRIHTKEMGVSEN